MINTTFLSHLAYFLFVLKNRGSKKFWKKYKVQEIIINGNDLGTNQIQIQETFQFLLKRDGSKSPSVTGILFWLENTKVAIIPTLQVSLVGIHKIFFFGLV